MKKLLVLMSLVVSLLACTPEGEQFLPGARFQWYQLNQGELVRFAHWDSLPEVPWQPYPLAERVSSHLVSGEEYLVVASPLGVMSLGSPDQFLYAQIMESPAMEGQSLDQIWKYEDEVFLSYHWEPGLETSVEYGRYPLEIARLSGPFGGWELIPFEEPPGEAGWQILRILPLPNSASYAFYLSNPDWSYQWRRWNPSAEGPAALLTLAEPESSLIQQYESISQLPEMIRGSHSTLMVRRGGDLPGPYSINQQDQGLAHLYENEDFTAALSHSGQFVLKEEENWRVITLPQIPWIRYRDPQPWRDRWVVLWERRRGLLVGRTGILVIKP